MRPGRVRFFLLVGIALGSQLGLGGSPAMAQQIYDFTFNSSIGGAPSSMSSIDFILSGTQVIGTVPDSGTGILSNGSLSKMNNYLGEGTLPALLSTSNAPFFSTSYQNYVVIDTSSDQFIFASSPGGGDVVDEVPADEQSGGSSGLSNESLTETPAPIPGAGILSYLVLGLAGLMVRGKALWWKSVTAMGNLRNPVRAKIFPARLDAHPARFPSLRAKRSNPD
jgi:hypothetical protein